MVSVQCSFCIAGRTASKLKYFAQHTSLVLVSVLERSVNGAIQMTLLWWLLCCVVTFAMSYLAVLMSFFDTSILKRSPTCRYSSTRVVIACSLTFGHNHHMHRRVSDTSISNLLQRQQNSSRNVLSQNMTIQDSTSAPAVAAARSLPISAAGDIHRQVPTNMAGVHCDWLTNQNTDWCFVVIGFSPRTETCLFA